MSAFEHQTLPFEDWTHEAHIRMAWNYLRTHPLVEAEQLVKQGIQRYNAVNKTRVSRGYHDTVTLCFVRLVAAALKSGPHTPTFEAFRRAHPHLMRSDVIWRYYSPARLDTDGARHGFVPPDLEPLPELS